MNLQFHDYHPQSDDLRQCVMTGFAGSPKQLPPKFFYDEEGSRLFAQICEQPEYYVPAVERSIFETHAADIMRSLALDGRTLIEPGAGCGRKVRFLLDRASAAMYVPMDISAEHLRSSAQRLAADYPHLPIHAVCVDHTQPFTLPDEIPVAGRIFFYPGSSLGNFSPVEAIGFLSDLRNKAGAQGRLLIGIDTKKSVEVLNRAYNDAAGVTAAFNLNLLRRIRQELAAEVQLDGFSHHAFYNEPRGRIEMHLVSRRDQCVRVADRRFEFKAGESIHTENSYKYSPQEFQELAWEAGWDSDKVWLDPLHYFSVHLLKARKG
ncbi:L-histidine N(alpha)-methyltransferase [uncultured Thiodictyon sp.]|uniref:L-histidine N(alpha)-methyltransferase n=1 Tax=uncultured Thiodictyon sp. TaxID=1846217 RepID=UPI0025F321CA|nr:L-histidine N(alpha)-methyltransferase [uncultured Thiodictyon sp.]